MQIIRGDRAAALLLGDARCCHQNISDLPSVEVKLGQVVKVALFKVFQRHARVAHPVDEHLEDGAFGLGREVVVAKGHMDPGLEGVVECLLRSLASPT